MSVPANIPERGAKPTIQLHAITPPDLEEVATFILRMSEGTEMPTAGRRRPTLHSIDRPIARAVERLSWILLENPAHSPDDPLGWLLRAPSGEIVGCMCCAPQKFCVGQTTFTLMMANSFYVDERHRGSGTSIFLKYLQLGRRYPLFVSSANPTVAEMWKKLGGYPLGNSGEEVLAIRRLPPLLEESVYRKTKSNLLARLTSTFASFWPLPADLFANIPGEELNPLRTPEEAANLCAEHHSDKITNCRDLSFLKWRYFSPVDPTLHLFAFRPGQAEQQIMVAVRLQDRGYKQQIRALHVLDIWGDVSSVPRNFYLSLAAALGRQYRDQIDLIVFRCLDPAQTRILAAHGFKVRRFAAPIAWCIDKHDLLSTKDWYFVPADGDMFL